MELDALTLKSAQRGAPRAREAFVRRYAGPLHAFLWRSGFRDELKDELQSLMAKLIEVLPRFDPNGTASLTTWVFTIAHRWMLDRRKRQHLQLAPIEEASDVPVEQASAEDLVIARQSADVLERAIASLPEAQRRVFVLAHLHEHPLEDIAREEGVPVGTIKSRLFRSRAALALAIRADAPELQPKGEQPHAHR